MLAARLLVRFGRPSSNLLSQTGRQNVTIPTRLNTSGVNSRSRVKTLSEELFGPAGETSIKIGQGIAAGASVVALGSLCYYGLGLSKETGAIDTHMLWPKYVKDRIKSTYAYLGAGLTVTAAAATLMSRSHAVMSFMSKNSLPAIFGTMAVMFGSVMLVRSLPYTETFGAKHLAWLAHASLMGAVLCPLAAMGGPLLIRAAWYTAGIIGGLSTLAMCAPSDKFLYMGAPLAMGFGLVFVSCIGSLFVPMTSALGAGLYSIGMYGGLVVFGGFILYDTQKTVDKAKQIPAHRGDLFDPINASLEIYIDAINIFVRIAEILFLSQTRKRK